MSTSAATAAPVKSVGLDDLRIAQETKEQAWSAVAAAEATLAELAATSRSVGTRVQVLSARLAQQDADRAHDVALLAALRADEAEASARAAWKDALRIEIFTRKRVAVTRLAKALLTARTAADELAAVEDDEASWLGQVADRLGWPVLTSATAGFEPQLDHWLQTCRKYRLLDDID